MLSDTINYLLNIATEALRANNARLFLDRFSSYHAAFHRRDITSRDIGFLMYHWCVIYYFRTLALDRIMNITPYTIRDFMPWGRFYTGNVFCGTWLERILLSRNINDLIRFSWQLELCHNEWHAGIETVTGAPMMDPARNIYFQAFWNLHFFIDSLFVQQLIGYRDANNLSFRTPYQIIVSLERSYPGLVGRI
jgi:hypothetical protein